MADTEDGPAKITGRQKLHALVGVARYRPRRTLAIAALRIVAAALEATGLIFILPSVEIAECGATPAEDVDQPLCPL